MYPTDVNNPMYYRSHPYKNQLDLPTSAFKNREIQQFYSEIPQGKEHFEQTNKKHFSSIFNRSQIQENKVFTVDYPQEEIEKSRLAMEKSYFRSLNVQDIEGAKPNTLISKAVKNREKAMTMMKKQEQNLVTKPTVSSPVVSKPFYNEVNKNGYHLPSGGVKVSKQEEAVNKYSRNKSILQNNSLRVLGNYNNQYDKPQSRGIQKNMKSISRGQAKQQEHLNSNSNYHFRSSQQNSNTNNNRFQPSALERELMEKERRIKELEKQLSRDHRSVQQRNRQFQQRNRQLQTVNPYKLQYPEAESSQLTKQKSISVPVQPAHQYRGQYPFNQTKNYQSDSYPINSQFQYQQYQQQSVSHDPHLINEMMPSTHNVQPTFKSDRNQIGYGSSVPSNPVQNNMRIQSDINTKMDKGERMEINRGESMEIDRRNIRKYNPTYLSFQSDRIKGSIAMTAQNLIL